MPKKIIKTKDVSQSYEMTRATVFLLENGKYALITEQGCSCYSSSEANIDLFSTEGRAVKRFDKWIKEVTKYRY